MVNWAPVSFNWQRTRHANMSGPFFCSFSHSFSDDTVLLFSSLKQVNKRNYLFLFIFYEFYSLIK